MKKKLFVALLLMALLPLNSGAQNENQPYLYIEMKNGEIIQAAVSEEYPNLSYTSSAVANLLNIEFSSTRNLMVRCDEIKQIFTKVGAPTGIETVNTSAAAENLSEVYSVSGVRMGKSTQQKDLPKGVYVVKKGSKTIKIVNR